MTQPIPPCCRCPEHQNPHVNEDGWVLTGLPDDPATWESWFPDEWRMHCANERDTKREAAA